MRYGPGGDSGGQGQNTALLPQSHQVETGQEQHPNLQGGWFTPVSLGPFANACFGDLQSLGQMVGSWGDGRA